MPPHSRRPSRQKRRWQMRSSLPPTAMSRAMPSTTGTAWSGWPRRRDKAAFVLYFWNLLSHLYTNQPKKKLPSWNYFVSASNSIPLFTKVILIICRRLEPVRNPTLFFSSMDLRLYFRGLHNKRTWLFGHVRYDNPKISHDLL